MSAPGGYTPSKGCMGTVSGGATAGNLGLQHCCIIERGLKIMAKQSHKLRIKRREAIEALLQEPSITAAAARLGVNRSTLHRWLNRPDFAAEVEAARRGEPEQEEPVARRGRRPWYKRGDTPTARRLVRAIHERASELFPHYETSDPRLMLAMLGSADPKLIDLRKQAAAKGVIV